jgi:hypothetical protein
MDKEVKVSGETAMKSGFMGALGVMLAGLSLPVIAIIGSLILIVFLCFACTICGAIGNTITPTNYEYVQ